ncbi:MAG TPA: hypothetical protein V6C97_17725 [Oculatellaceae cyanobacterium]
MLVNTLVGIILFILLSDLAIQNKLVSLQGKRGHVRMSDLENPGIDWLGAWTK